MRYIASIFFLLLALIATAAAGEANIVTLKEKAAVSGEQVLLGDIAAIRGPQAGELAALGLVKSPRTGPGVTLSAQFVASKAREKLPHAAVSMEGAPRVHVCALQARIPGADLEALFRDAVLKSSPFTGGGGMEITGVKTPPFISVPEKDKGLLKAKFSPGEDFLGLVTATISAGDNPSEICRVSGTIRVMAPVLVVSRAIRRGSLITEGDLELKTLDISASPLLVRDMKECLGMRAKTTLVAGKPLLRSNIVQPPLISRGDLVAIEANADGFTVMDRGIALKDGNLGEKIPIRNAGSGKQILGTIIAHSVVEVTF